MDITLGPVLYHWSPDKWRDFYFRIADESPMDTVSIGEVVCSKRMQFYQPVLSDVIGRLERAGKNILLSSYILISLERERKQTEKLVRDAAFPVEINDISCLPHLHDGQPFAVGPFVNTYNEGTAHFFASKGCQRICLPPELPLGAMESIAHDCPQIYVEVFAFGRVPLAISARCYHARLHKYSKDNCKFVCGEDPDGLDVNTLRGENFLSVNGVQTLSHTCVNLLPHLEELKKAGIRSLRLSPQNCDMVEISTIFRKALDGHMTADEALTECRRVYPDVPFANGFVQALPGAEWKSALSQINGTGAEIL